MPTETATLGWTFANWGSAPSTWSANSCTPTPAVYLADRNSPEFPALLETCPDDEIGECWPRPDDNELIDDYLDDIRNVPYWSPGVRCPADWTSVGEAARTGTGDVDSTGILTVDALPTPGWELVDPGNFIAIGYHNALGAILEPSETAIACCPRYLSLAPPPPGYTI